MQRIPPATFPATAKRTTHRATGPNPGMLAGVSLALTVAGLLASLLLTGVAYVSPFARAAELVQYYGEHQEAARLTTMLLFGSAVPLGIFAATAYTRLLRLGVRVPGPSIGFFGGLAASAALMISAMSGWVAAHEEVSAHPEILRALALLAFISGGVGCVVGLGLLVAGIAVPGLVLGLFPRWIGWAGLAIAAIAEVTFLSMAVTPLQFLLPLARYGALAWLVAIGFLLPVQRADTPSDRS